MTSSGNAGAVAQRAAEHVALPARAMMHSGVEDVAAMFKLLGDPTRCRILYALLETQELCVQDISAATGASQTSVSAALRLLRTARVVAGRRDGRMVHYRIADGHVRMVLDMSWEHAGHTGHAVRQATR